MAPDPAIALLGLLALLLLVATVGVVLRARARRRRRAQVAEEGRLQELRLSVPGSSHDVARWVTEGHQLFTTWQERIERLEELQNRLAAMADEIGRLRAEVARIDELRSDITRLGHEVDRLRTERDGLQDALARVQEIARGAIARSPEKATE